MALKAVIEVVRKYVTWANVIASALFVTTCGPALKDFTTTGTLSQHTLEKIIALAGAIVLWYSRIPGKKSPCPTCGPLLDQIGKMGKGQLVTIRGQAAMTVADPGAPTVDELLARLPKAATDSPTTKGS